MASLGEFTPFHRMDFLELPVELQAMVFSAMAGNLAITEWLRLYQVSKSLRSCVAKGFEEWVRLRGYARCFGPFACSPAEIQFIQAHYKSKARYLSRLLYISG